MTLRPKLLMLALLLITIVSQSDNDKQEDRVNTIYGHGAVVQSVAYSPNGKLLATGDWNGEINIYSVDSGMALLQTLYGHEAVVTTLQFSRDSKKLISGGNDLNVITWKYTNDWIGFEMDQQSRTHQMPVSSVAYGPGMKMIFSAGADGKVVIKNLENKKDRTIDHKKMINTMVISSNRQYIYVGDESTVIQEYDMLGNAKREFEGHKGEVLSLAYAPNRLLMLSGSTDKTAIIWDLTRARVKHVLSLHSWKVNSVDVSSDSKYGVTGGKDGYCFLWDMNEGELLDSFKVEGGDINAVSFNHDNQYVAIGARYKGEELNNYGAIIWKTGLPSRFAKPKTPPQKLPESVKKQLPPNSKTGKVAEPKKQ